jgi:hypothetical protein
MTNKLFSIAGVSTLKGKTKIRFANDAMRIKVLLKNGHDVGDMIDLPKPMTKAEIATYLKEIDFAKGDPAVADAVAYIALKNPASPQPVQAAPEKTADMVTA